MESPSTPRYPDRQLEQVRGVDRQGWRFSDAQETGTVQSTALIDAKPTFKLWEIVVGSFDESAELRAFEAVNTEVMVFRCG